MNSLRFGRHDRYHDISLVPGTIKFTEEDILPGGKSHLAIHDGDGLLGPHDTCLQVRIAVVVLVIMLPDTGRHQAVKKSDNIILNRLIPVLLDHNSCRGSLGVDIDQAGLNAGFSDDGLHLAGDVVEAVVGGCGYLDGSLHGRILGFP
jgi:hypothetical protein